MTDRRRVAPAFFSLFLLSGCLATSQEIQDLRSDIIRLQASLEGQKKTQAEFQDALKTNQDALQGNQADLMAKMGDLTRNLDVLSSHLEESDGRMDALGERLDDLNKNVTNRLDAVVKTVQGVKSLPAPSPTKLFTVATSDFNHRRYDQALATFQAYLDQYGDTQRAPQAQYQIGEIHTAQKNWADALAAYEEVIAAYPKSAEVPAALVRKGQTLEALGKPEEAVAAYRVLVRGYPHRKEALAARDRLKSLKADLPTDAAPKPPATPRKRAPAPKPQ